MKKRELFNRLFFIFLLNGMLTFSIGAQPLIFGTGNVESQSSIQLCTYEPNIKTSGGDINVILHQSLLLNPALIEILNMSDTSNNSISVTCPKDSRFNSSFVNISLIDLYAPNTTVIIQDNNIETGQTDFTNSQPAATSFYMPTNGYLDNVSIHLNHATTPTDNNISIVLYNSTWDSTNSRSTPGLKDNRNDFRASLANITMNIDNIWYNATNLHYYLDNSLTENNTWFIGVFDQSGGAATWDWAGDSAIVGDGTDSTKSYLFAPFTNWTIITNGPFGEVDFHLKVGVSRNDNTPEPTDIGLTINGTAVTNTGGGANSGNWLPSAEYSDPEGDLNFKLTADWYYVSCNISSIQINYTKTDQVASTYEIYDDDEILWNVTRNGGFNLFEDSLTNYYINFTIPAKWDNVSVYNGTDNKTGDIYSDNLNNGYVLIQVLNAGNGTYWFLNATSGNLAQSITTDPEEGGIRDSFKIYVTFNHIIQQNDGIIVLNIYSEGNDYSLIKSVSLTPFQSDTEFFLYEWMPTDYDRYYFHVSWYNSTDAGLIADYRDIVEAYPPPPFPFSFIITIIISGIAILIVVVLLILRRRSVSKRIIND